MSIFEHPDFNSHELVAFKEDRKSGLRAIIAIHNANLGPALGGCRIFPYADSNAALSDVLRLSRGMTYKSALAGLPLGGGKSVIIADPKTDKTQDLLLAMGDFIESLGGRYITAEDSGTSVADIKMMAERTEHVSGILDGSLHGGDPSPSTAYGVFKGIEAGVAWQYQSGLSGIKVALQGIGNVGFYLARLLRNAGATVYAADINPQNLERAVNELGVIAMGLDEILCADVDVLAPCALGGAVNAQSIDQIRAGVVAGAANNQLADETMGDALRHKGILYAPDFVINAGGIIDVFYQRQGTLAPDAVQAKVGVIGETTTEIFDRARTLSLPTDQVAEQLAEERFKAVSKSCAA